MSASEDEGVVTRQGPRYDQLAAANARLNFFAADPPCQTSRFDEPPPPYRSSPGSTPSDGEPDPPEDEGTEASRPAFTTSMKQMKRIIGRDLFTGMNEQERRRALEHEQWLWNRHLASEVAENQKYRISRTPTHEPTFFKMSLAFQMQEGRGALVDRTEDKPVIPAPKKAKGRPRRTTIQRDADQISRHPSARAKNSAESEQRRGPRRSARIAAKTAAAEKALPPARESKASRAPKVSKRGRGRRPGR